MKGKRIWKKISAVFAAGFCGALLLGGCGLKPGNSTGGSFSSSDSLPDSSSESSGGATVETVYEPENFAPDYAEISDVGYTRYYFDSQNGADTNDGLSEASPKKSLSAANELIKAVSEPTMILFKAGSTYRGTLELAGYAATKEQPLLIDSYAETETAQYAKIESTGICVVIRDGNLRVSGLELTAPTGQNGISISTSKAGALSDLVISDNYIHDVNFRWSLEASPEDTDPHGIDVRKVTSDTNYTYGHGGIVLNAATNKFVGPSWCEDVWIENNVIERTSRVGMFLNSSWAQRPGMNWGYNGYYDDEHNYYPHKRFVIRNNAISYTGGDGIVLLAGRDSYIENNTCYHAQYLGRANFWNAGIWIHSGKDIVIRNNEAAYTHFTNDGQGFDIDIGCSDILFEKNYSHDNEGGGILLCNQSTEIAAYDREGNLVLDGAGLPDIRRRFSPWDRVTLRNNVFADNGGSVVHVGGKCDGISFENNTVIVKGESFSEPIVSTADFGNSGEKGGNWKFVNNIFYVRQPKNSRLSMSFCKSYTFENNVFCGYPEEFNKTLSGLGKNNKVFEVGFAGFYGGDGLDGAKIFASDNPEVLSVGAKLEKMAQKDYGGNEAEGISYVGAFAVTKEKRN